MTAPRWIVEAFEVMMAGPGVGDPEVEILAAALLERLPLEAMGAALALPIAKLSDIVRRLRETSERAPDVRAVPMRLVHQSAFDELIAYVGSGDCGRLEEVVRALTADHDAVTIAELYQGACRALDAAGVPYATGGDDGQIPARLNLTGRILWLIEQRPTRLELQRVEAERDAARALMDATVKLAADRAAERDQARERVAEVDRNAMEEIARLAAERDRSRTTVSDLTEQRAATERALTRAGAPMDELTNEQGAVWLHREIDALKERLLKAETERDALRGLLASG